MQFTSEGRYALGLRTTSDLSDAAGREPWDDAIERYPIDSTVVEVASPLGGGLYVEVPRRESVGVVTIRIRNAIGLGSTVLIRS